MRRLTGCASAAGGHRFKLYLLGLVDLYIQPAGAVDIEASSHIHTIVHTRRYFLVVAGRTRTVRHHIKRQMLEGHILQQLARAGSKGMGSS